MRRERSRRRRRRGPPSGSEAERGGRALSGASGRVTSSGWTKGRLGQRSRRRLVLSFPMGRDREAEGSPKPEKGSGSRFSSSTSRSLSSSSMTNGSGAGWKGLRRTRGASSPSEIQTLTLVGAAMRGDSASHGSSIRAFLACGSRRHGAPCLRSTLAAASRRRATGRTCDWRLERDAYALADGGGDACEQRKRVRFVVRIFESCDR